MLLFFIVVVVVVAVVFLHYFYCQSLFFQFSFWLASFWLGTNVANQFLQPDSDLDSDSDSDSHAHIFRSCLLERSFKLRMTSLFLHSSQLAPPPPLYPSCCLCVCFGPEQVAPTLEWRQPLTQFALGNDRVRSQIETEIEIEISDSDS